MTLKIICHFFAFFFALNLFAGEGPEVEIVLGQTASFAGHLGLYGNLIKNAINAYFKRVNEAGGIKGLKLRLESMEDHGDPIMARKNIKSMLKNNINMFIGCAGTRSILNVLPLIKNKEIAMFFPWAGHESLRQRDLSNIINGLGYLKPQLEMIAKNVVKKRKFKKIAIFYADDDFSAEAAHDLEVLLRNYGVTALSTASYNRMTMDIVSGAKTLLAADPKVVICISTSMPAVKLISQFFKHGHYATEFVGVDSTLFVGDILKDKGACFCFSSSVPDPRASDTKIAEMYRQDIKKYYPGDSYNILSFAYYISAAIVVEAIKKVESSITKEKVLAEIEAMQAFDIGGFTINFDANNRHAFGLNASLVSR